MGDAELPDVELLEGHGTCGTCPGGHTLQCFLASRDDRGYGCDVCGATIMKGEQLWGCRVCNYDKCVKCASKQLPPLMPASAQNSIETAHLDVALQPPLSGTGGSDT